MFIMDKNTWVVIPAYNEENTIKRIVKEAKKLCNILVVDDSSTDNTAKLAKGAGAFLMRHKYNMGYGSSLKDGINYAIKKKAKFIITMDADGQHNPKDISKFIKELEKGADIVSGSRFLKKRIWGTWKRTIAIKALALQLYVFSGLKLTDAQSGFRGYRSEVFKNMKIEDSGMAFSIEVPIKAKKMGYKFVEIPIEIKRPYIFKSFWSVFRQGINIGLGIIKYSLK